LAATYLNWHDTPVFLCHCGWPQSLLTSPRSRIYTGFATWAPLYGLVFFQPPTRAASRRLARRARSYDVYGDYTPMCGSGGRRGVQRIVVFANRERETDRAWQPLKEKISSLKPRRTASTNRAGFYFFPGAWQASYARRHSIIGVRVPSTRCSGRDHSDHQIALQNSAAIGTDARWHHPMFRPRRYSLFDRRYSGGASTQLRLRQQARSDPTIWLAFAIAHRSFLRDGRRRAQGNINAKPGQSRAIRSARGYQAAQARRSNRIMP